MDDAENLAEIAKQLKDKLKYWGVPDDFYIEDEAKEFILTALSSEKISSVYIDKDNGLCIDEFE
jgi:hypothetical protein